MCLIQTGGTRYSWILNQIIHFVSFVLILLLSVEVDLFVFDLNFFVSYNFKKYSVCKQLFIYLFYIYFLLYDFYILNWSSFNSERPFYRLQTTGHRSAQTTDHRPHQHHFIPKYSKKNLHKSGFGQPQLHNNHRSRKKNNIDINLNCVVWYGMV